jgi:hypothetical protein
VRFELGGHLLRQRAARIEHDAQQADHLQVAVEVGVHLLDGVDQIGQAFQRVVLALHRDDDAVAAHRPFSVSRLRLGGQSMRTKS